VGLFSSLFPNQNICAIIQHRLSSGDAPAMLNIPPSLASTPRPRPVRVFAIPRPLSSGNLAAWPSFPPALPVPTPLSSLSAHPCLFSNLAKKQPQKPHFLPDSRKTINSTHLERNLCSGVTCFAAASFSSKPARIFKKCPKSAINCHFSPDLSSSLPLHQNLLRSQHCFYCLGRARSSRQSSIRYFLSSTPPSPFPFPLLPSS